MLRLQLVIPPISICLLIASWFPKSAIAAHPSAHSAFDSSITTRLPRFLNSSAQPPSKYPTSDRSTDTQTHRQSFPITNVRPETIVVAQASTNSPSPVTPPPVPPPTPVPTATPTVPTRQTVKPTETLRIPLNPFPTLEAGQSLAVLVGITDVTSQVKLIDRDLVYQPDAIPLPLGDVEVVVYLVKSPIDWQILTQLSLTVTEDSAIAQGSSEKTPISQPSLDSKLAQAETIPNEPSAEKPVEQSTEKPTEQPTEKPTENPTESSTEKPAEQPTEKPAEQPIEAAPFNQAAFLLQPTVNLNLKSQFLERRTPDAGVPDRPTFTDLTFQGGFSTTFTAGTFISKSNFAFVGSTFQNEALRFGELGENAPPVDLSEYLLDTTWGPVQALLGHTCHGNHPFLLNNACSRGLVIKTQLTDRLSLDLSSLRSESIVGFDNFFGLENSDNNTNAITLGYQILKSEAGGGVRFEATFMDGSKLAEGNFNEGQVVDAEKSRGFGLRLTGNDNSNRFKFDLGYALSTFTNPSEPDPELTDGLNVVEVEPVTKDAYYLEASYELLKEVPIGGDRTFSLSLSGRHERINPLYKSLGAAIGADQMQTQLALNGSLAGATFQIQHTESEDNLANIPTILKTKNRATSFNLTVPLQTVLKTTNVFLPTLTYSYQLNRQFGANVPIPELSEFDASEIPNQVTTSHQLGASWTIDSLSLSFQHSNTLQDNRQLGRETSDFLNISNQINASWQASPTLQISLGLNLTSAKNFETNVTQFTTSPTLGITWEFVRDLTWTFNFNRTDNTDSIDQNLNRSDSLESILTWKFKVLAAQRELPGTFFIRYSLQSTRNQDRVFNLNTDATIHVVNAGLSLSF
ncbi:hypothetical protein ACN4EG_12330 [Alkalinema pantanalense CENA528]|uniref:hypothetical protein n=1 Tax=Alkalinema pantanalense TaxID=1620705 RepID=UPI003D6F9F69